MKRINLFLAIILVAVLFSGCGKKNDPIAIASNFAEAYLVEHDVEKYTSFLDERTREALLSPVMTDYHKEQQTKFKDLKLSYTLNKQKSIENESGASIYFDIVSKKDPNLYNRTERVDLQKGIDGKWYIDYYTLPTRF